jgi:acetylornithine deacetylase/succinyl-diaminopimelate desuccinylase-like protein
MSESTEVQASEVEALCSALIRIDTSNPGRAERPAAEYVATLLAQAGIEPVLLEAEPGRTNVVARIAGTDPARPALLVHGHLDVVPAQAGDWSVPPFSGEIDDEFVWGRGAVDMKGMDAMVLAVVRSWSRAGYRPERDIVLAFLADEETGSVLGSHWLVDQHADLFDGCTEAVGEVGGFSYSLSESARLYPIMTAEKGTTWLRLVARGTAGHGSMVSADNPVVTLCEAITRLAAHRFPVHLTDSVRGFLAGLAQASGLRFDEQNPDACLRELGPFARVIAATLRNTANPTVLTAGGAINVVPGRAEAFVDGRFLPGYEAEFRAELAEVLGPAIEAIAVSRDIAVETAFDGPLVQAMCAALLAHDPAAIPVPYMMSGGTDAKAFDRLGIRCFGFSPLLLPADLDFGGLFHGVDERIPRSGLIFGERVLDRFLRTS